jgi:K+-sensing histidine kinase KdpD
MSGFLAGMISGCIIGAVITLLLLLIVSGAQGKERNPPRQVSQRKVFVAALILLAVGGACYSMDLEKSALLALLLSVLLVAKLGGSKRGIVAACIAVLIVAWFLPPYHSLWVSGLDNRIALILFILGTFVGSIVMEGDQWIKRWITNTDPDR